MHGRGPAAERPEGHRQSPSARRDAPARCDCLLRASCSVRSFFFIATTSPLACVESTDAGAAAATPGKKKKWTFSSKTLFGSGGGGAAQAPESYQYASSRFKCPLRGIAEALASDKLSDADFPLAAGQEPSGGMAKPTAQSVRGQWGSAKKQGFSGGRCLVFMAGGVTHAEMTAASEVSELANKEVIVGGTSILTPVGFIEGLKAVSR